MTPKKCQETVIGQLEQLSGQYALEEFARLPSEKVQAIAFEIAVLNSSGLDVNNPQPKYELKELSGKFSGLNLSA